MSLHDHYARLTPFELAFQARSRADALASAVEEEAAARGADPGDPQAFITMGSVGEFLAELRGPGAPPETVHQYGALAFHGVHFTREDCPLYLLSTHLARYLVEGAPSGAPRLPAAAGYLQLPQHLFWIDGDVPGAPESVDGIFWTSHRVGVLHTLLVTGMRPGRPGIGVIPLPDAPFEDAPLWITADVRSGGEDFSSELPGADLDDLYSFQAAGEVLKLLARFFAFRASVPEASEGATLVTEASGDGPVPSGLPFVRVSIDG